MAMSGTGCQQSGMAMPSSLLISSKLVRQMCRASLMSNVVVSFTWSNIQPYWVMLSLLWLTSLSVPIWWKLSTPLCGSQGLSSSPLYIHGHNCKGSGTQLPTSSPAGHAPCLSSAVHGGWMLIGKWFTCCIFCILSHILSGIVLKVSF